MEFKLVYGNHGKDPFHIMDTLLLVKLSLEALGYKVDLEERMTPGRTNILVECFTYDFVEAMKDVRSAPDTEFIIIGTEFLTGKTFNNFDTGDHRTLDSHYDIPDYWSKRFRTFLAAQQYARAIWHLADCQVEAFKEATNHPTVAYLPHGYVEGFDRVRHKPTAHKDIDAVFTGTLTHHRSELIRELRQRGVNAIATTPLNFVQREDLVARAKIGLNLKQTEAWLYPSNSRYHYHLSNDSLLVSENCPISCDLSPFVVAAPARQFTELCCQVIAAGNWAAQAKERKERFVLERPMTQLMANLLHTTYDGA